MNSSSGISMERLVFVAPLLTFSSGGGPRCDKSEEVEGCELAVCVNGVHGSFSYVCERMMKTKLGHSKILGNGRR